MQHIPSSRIVLTAALLFAGALSGVARAQSSDDVVAAIGSGDCKTAGAAINAAMDRNDPQGYYYAGYLYDATGCVKDDPAKAAHFYRRAADGGNADAANALAVLYGTGRGVERDYAEAYRWYASASKATGTAQPPVEGGAIVAAGYAMTVVRIAHSRLRYPRQMEQDGVTATFDTVFVPATGAVTFRNMKSGVAIGSNVSRSYVFTQAVGDAYSAALATLPRPDGIGADLAFVTPWHFTMLRGNDGGPTKNGDVTLGATTTAAP